MVDNRTLFDAFQQRLNNTVPQSGPVRIVSKRSRRSAQLAEVSKKNAMIVDQLADLAEQLAKKGQSSEVRSLINIMREILNNNQKLQELVGEALQDAPD